MNMTLGLKSLPVSAAGFALLIGMSPGDWTSTRSPSAQDSARPVRAADGKPNLNGVWQTMNTANWDIQDHPAQPGPHGHLLGAMFYIPPGKGVVEGNELPYQPWAQEKRKANFESRLVMD